MMVAYSCLMTFVMGKDFYLDLIRAMRNTSSLVVRIKPEAESGYFVINPKVTADLSSDCSINSLVVAVPRVQA